MSKKTVVRYVVDVSIPGIGRFPAASEKGKLARRIKGQVEPSRLAMGDLNQSWGFEDGNCNERGADGVIVSKPGGDSPDFLQAVYNAAASHKIRVLVEVARDGTKSFRIVGG